MHLSNRKKIKGVGRERGVQHSLAKVYEYLASAVSLCARMIHVLASSSRTQRTFAVPLQMLFLPPAPPSFIPVKEFSFLTPPEVISRPADRPTLCRICIMCQHDLLIPPHAQSKKRQHLSTFILTQATKHQNFFFIFTFRTTPHHTTQRGAKLDVPFGLSVRSDFAGLSKTADSTESSPTEVTYAEDAPQPVTHEDCFEVSL